MRGLISWLESALSFYIGLSDIGLSDIGTFFLRNRSGKALPLPLYVNDHRNDILPLLAYSICYHKVIAPPTFKDRSSHKGRNIGR